MGCRRRANVDELSRVVADPAGRLVAGAGKPGRGAWICRGSSECLQTAIKRKAFARALRTTLACDATTALEGLAEGRDAWVCEDRGTTGRP